MWLVLGVLLLHRRKGEITRPPVTARGGVAVPAATAPAAAELGAGTGRTPSAPRAARASRARVKKGCPRAAPAVGRSPGSSAMQAAMSSAAGRGRAARCAASAGEGALQAAPRAPCAAAAWWGACPVRKV